MKMPNKLLLPVIGLLVLGAGAVAVTRRPTSVPSAPASQTTGQAMDEASEFAKAIQSGRPTVCTITKDNSQMEYRLKGKMMRVNVMDQSTTSHTISDTKYFYVWTDGQNQGTKIALPSEEEFKNLDEQVKQTPQTAPALTTENDFTALKNEGYTINCQAGNVSDSDFVPPSSINFQDLSTMMQAIPSPANLPSKY